MEALFGNSAWHYCMSDSVVSLICPRRHDRKTQRRWGLRAQSSCWDSREARARKYSVMVGTTDWINLEWDPIRESRQVKCIFGLNHNNNLVPAIRTSPGVSRKAVIHCQQVKCIGSLRWQLSIILRFSVRERCWEAFVSRDRDQDGTWWF